MFESLTNVVGRLTSPTKRSVVRQARLRLEPLETRYAPAGFNYLWDGPVGGGNWDDPNNWNTNNPTQGTIPGSSDDVTIKNVGGTISAPANGVTINYLNITNFTGTLTLNGIMTINDGFDMDSGTIDQPGISRCPQDASE